MSFVLEALKKQEADRDPDAAVSLARSAVRERRYRIWVALFAVAMAANVALLLWLFDPLGRMPDRGTQAADTPRSAPSANAERPAPAAPMPGPSTAGPSRLAQPRPTTPSVPASADWNTPRPARSGAGSSTAPAEATAAATEPAEASTPAAAPARVPPAPTTAGQRTAPAERHAPSDTVALEDLPSPARARFPGIAFSTHIYAEDQDLRAVVANGKRHQEGDRIRGLEILEITAGGVVLGFEGYRVEVPVVVDWDSL